jgi:hypothetical protein
MIAARTLNEEFCLVLTVVLAWVRFAASFSTGTAPPVPPRRWWQGRPAALADAGGG